MSSQRVLSFVSVVSLVVLAASLGTQAVRAQDLYDESTVRVLDLRFQESNWYQILTTNYSSKTFLKATLTVDGKVYKDVGVRFRGNTSYSNIGTSQKKPFELALEEFVPGQNLYGFKTLNLNNGFRDPTFVREVIAWRLFRRFVPACRCNYVKLVINNENWGPYINVQQVDKTMLRAWFRDEDGNRYRAERQAGASQHASALTWLGDRVDLYKGGYEVKGAPTNPWVDVCDLCHVLNNTALAQLPAELPKILDVELALRYLAVNNVLPAVDSYIGNTSHNYYLYNDPYHARFALLPWDLNASFGGNSWLTVQEKVRLDPFYQFTHAQRPLITRTLGHSPWRHYYLAQIRALLDDGYDWATIGAWVKELQTLIEPELRADTKRIYSMQDFADNVVRDVSITVNLVRQTIPGLEPMVKGRAAFLRQHVEVALPAPTLTKLAHAPLDPKVVDDVSLTVVASSEAVRVSAFARMRGAWLELPMFDDGLHGDGAAKDGVYGVVLGKLPYGTEVEYYCGAEASAARGGAVVFEPRAAGHAPRRFRVDWPRRSSTVTINEVLASNKSGIKDEAGEREDWIELYHAGSQPLDISGYSLTDDASRPRRWVFPVGTIVPARGTILVWADAEPGDGVLHATFKLDADGEELLLFDRDGWTVLDELRFGAQQPDVATGRLFDGGLPWVSFPFASSPRANNAPGLCAYRHYSGMVGTEHALTLRASGVPKLASQATWTLLGAPPQGAYLLLLSATPEHLAIPGLGWSLLVGLPLAATLVVPADAAGAATLQFLLPNDALLDGARIYCSPLTLSARGLEAGNAIEALLCR